MRTFQAATLQDASDLPWIWMNPTACYPVWGVNIIPQAVYSSYDEAGAGIGKPICYTWSAMLDPADTQLPAWITETTPQIAEINLQEAVNSTN
jgi:hypothetical protein